MRILDGTTLAAIQDYLGGRLQQTSSPPLNRQLYLHLRGAILSGALARGAQLPSSRALADALSLARNTVLHAYAQLEAEGYLCSRTGAGTFVSDIEQDTLISPDIANSSLAAPATLSARSQGLLHALGSPTHTLAPTFPTGVPDLAAFPWQTWLRLLHRHQRQAQPKAWGYMNAGGHASLKAALATYLRLSRGVNCTPEQILITTGMQQAMWLIALATADAGDTVWMEEPGYVGARMAWQALGLNITPTPIDEEGMRWAEHAPTPKLIYVTPSHQYPLGSVMSVKRRQALLQEAYRHRAWVIEDDYDSEFRHKGTPIAALQGLDQQGQVIYLGTFSKVLFPALRLGYVVAPLSLITPLRQLHTRLTREGSYQEQAALADFMNEGHFGAHLRRMRLIYARRQEKLRHTLNVELGDLFGESTSQIALLGGAAGMHVTLRLPLESDEQHVCTALAARGISVSGLSSYCLHAPPFPGLVLGYGSLDDASLVLNAVRLARALKETLTPPL